jgi:hypothetical protein
MKFSKRVVLCLILFLVLALPGFSQDLGSLQKGLGSITEDLGKDLILNSTLGLTWADSYIGQLIGVPPHFGIGISLGFTPLNTDSLGDIFDAFNSDFDDNFGSSLPLPAAAVEARFGGVGIPFDVGIKILPLPPIGANGTTFQYTMVGGDFRYAVLKDRGILPGVSVGVGLTYTAGEINHELSGLTSLNYGIDSITFGTANPDLNFYWKNTTLDFKAQVSKKFFIVTPYAGLGASYGWSTVGYEVDGNVTVSNINNINAALKNAGLETIDASGGKFGSESKFDGFAFRAFGGASLNLAVFRIDLAGLYDLVNQNWGANLGLRFQL